LKKVNSIINIYLAILSSKKSSYKKLRKVRDICAAVITWFRNTLEIGAGAVVWSLFPIPNAALANSTKEFLKASKEIAKNSSGDVVKKVAN
jgi:hypothetical protein